MTRFSAELGNSYTDAPELHSNLILGALQLLVWLFIHPSAWHNHIEKIRPPLRPNFRLTELDRKQWRDPYLRSLLLMGHGVLPLLSGLLTALLLWILGEPGRNIIFGLLFGAAAGIAGIFGSLLVSTAVSIVVGVIISIGSGLSVGGMWVRVAPILGNNASEAAAAETLILSVGLGFIFGVSGSLVGDVGSSVTSRKQFYSSSRQIGVTIVGILVGGVVQFVGFSLTTESENVAFISLMIGVLVWATVGRQQGLKIGGALGLISSLAFTLAFIVGGQAATWMVLFTLLGALSYVLAQEIAGPWAGAIASAVGASGGWVAAIVVASNTPIWPILPLNVAGLILGLTLTVWRPVLFYSVVAVWNTLLRRADEQRGSGQRNFLRWHSAFWDEHQRLRLFGLDEHILLVMERNPSEGRAAIEYLSTSNQRWAAQAAQIELEARWLESCQTAEVIASVHRSLAAGELAGPASALLRSFSRISQDVMAALQQGSAYNQRLALSGIEDRLDSLVRELTRSSERYAVRFRSIATSWRKSVAAFERDLAETIELRQEIDNPYVIGVPLTEQQEIFVGRTDIGARIEQLLLDRRRPPLLLYGQRRLGKTSLLNNLGRLLPSTIIPLFIDLQGPASQASDHAGFFYNIARGMINSARRQRNLILPPLPRDKLVVDPFTYFDEWLDEVEQVLQQHTALVALDEFEALDSAIAKGNLDGEALLNMMRHLIQHRPQFKILLTSSQSLDEFQRWSSYLINIQVVHIGYLNESEARQLIERPVKNFGLRFETQASQRVLGLTRGHPFLVQLLCGEIVAYKNEQDPTIRRLARLDDVEAVISEVLQRGSFFFADIERNQIDANGLSLLRYLAGQGEKAVVERQALANQIEQPGVLEQTLTRLTRRELIEPVSDGYRFQVELIRRWFAS